LSRNADQHRRVTSYQPSYRHEPFKFDQLQDPEREFEDNSVIRARKSLQFVPYLQERTANGHLIHFGDEETATSQSQVNSPHVKGDPFKRDNFLDMTLQEKIEIMALKKRGNAVRSTTSQNVRKTRQNARLKIVNQVKYSKRHGVKFANTNFVATTPQSASLHSISNKGN
jgi:hypothetical protein